MRETLRRSNEPVGEGEPVEHGGARAYVDSWSIGARVVWLRKTAERGAISVEVRPEEVGLRIGYAE
jgi:hypothetical protein